MAGLPSYPDTGPGVHARALGRVQRVLPVRGGRPRRRVRPDRTPRRM